MIKAIEARQKGEAGEGEIRRTLRNKEGREERGRPAPPITKDRLPDVSLSNDLGHSQLFLRQSFKTSAVGIEGKGRGCEASIAGRRLN